MIKHIKKAVSNYQRERWYLDALLRDDLHTPDPKALRMYVCVRSDVLPPVNQGIQALHAVTEMFVYSDEQYAEGEHDLYSKLWVWAQVYKTLVLLGSDEISFDNIIRRARKYYIPFVVFQEPDLENLVTAVAFQPMTQAEAKDLTFGYYRAE